MAKKQSIPTIRLNIFLIKSSVKKIESALKDDDKNSLSFINVKQGFLIDGMFVLKSERPKPLKWLQLLRPILQTEQDLSKIFSSYASALLFVKAKNRIFALSFGGGKSLLKPGSFETDFGLKVALNTINPEKLRSIDIHNLDDSAMQVRKQSGQNSELGVFGLDVERDLLRSVTGVPTNSNFAIRITGRDSLLIQTRRKVSELSDLCEEALKYFGQTSYKEHFDWLDHLRPVSDPIREQELFGYLLKAINSRSAEGMHLSFPEILSGEEQYEFKYPTGKRLTNPTFEDLNIDDFFVAMPEDFQFDLPHLKSLRIQAKAVESNQFIEKWRLIDCLTFEKKIGRESYILSLGQWYRVKESLIDDVSSYVRAHYLAAHNLVPFKPNEVEADYNKRMAKALDLALFDQKTKTVPGASTPIEVCDLFGEERIFYHVKRKMRSSTLSHLFSQGYVSGVSLIDSREFRAHSREVLKEAKKSLALIPLDKFNASDFKIHFAIMAKRRGAIESQLPFFSQLTFRQNAKTLERMGYEVRLLRVDQK